LAMGGCSDVVFVERVTITNRTDYPASVDVTDANRTEWLGLGLVHHDGRHAFGEVIDQGEVWIFRFDYANKHHQEVEVTRSELQRDEWQVEVPGSFGDELRRLGFEPPP